MHCTVRQLEQPRQSDNAFDNSASQPQQPLLKLQVAKEQSPQVPPFQDDNSISHWSALPHYPFRSRRLDIPNSTSQNTSSYLDLSQYRCKDRDNKVDSSKIDGLGQAVDEYNSLVVGHTKQLDQFMHVSSGTYSNNDLEPTNLFSLPLGVSISTSRKAFPRTGAAKTENDISEISSREDTSISEEIEPFTRMLSTNTSLQVSSVSPQSVSRTKPACFNQHECDEVDTTYIVGLRDVQEAEKKKREARKAASREKQKHARPPLAASSISTPEVPTITASLGLPISQTDSQPDGNIFTTKDTVDAFINCSSGNVAAWTNVVPSPSMKQSMKQIQEEEERGKLQTAEQKETGTSAARRAHAKMATKVYFPFTSAKLPACLRTSSAQPRFLL